MNLTINSYQPEDLENTVQLWYCTWHQTFPYIQHPQSYLEWKSRFRDELAIKGHIWLAKLENRIVGFIVVIPEEQCLEQIFVDTAYQNQGIGSMLLDKAKAICPQGLKLHTLQQNMQARAFYEKHGFQVRRLSINKINGQPNIEYLWIP
ncbi:GNAT family N-acetyltransferase [Nostocales cyanobacterium LEGE 11386]|nr:GNAT family N-acetyltransferase [Nostocales cyanobacterium LEGE 11386]